MQVRHEGSEFVGFVGCNGQTKPGWWFQTFFIFTPTWGRFPFWLIFFRWVETHQPETLAIALNLVVFWSCKFSVVISFFPPESYTDQNAMLDFERKKAALRSITTGRREPNRGAEYYYLQGRYIPPWWIHLHPPPGWQVLMIYIQMCKSQIGSTTVAELRDAQLGTASFFWIYPQKNKETTHVIREGIPRPKQTFFFFLFFFSKKLFTYGQLLIFWTAIIFANELGIVWASWTLLLIRVPSRCLSVHPLPEAKFRASKFVLVKKSIHMRFPLLQMRICTHTLYNRKDVLYIYICIIYIHHCSVRRYLCNWITYTYIYIQIYISKMLV